METEQYGNNFPRPLPELVEGEESYIIDMILRHRKRAQNYQYLIKWQGYPISEATWENEEAFNSDSDMLATYKHRHHIL